ncbi:hypothetical protein CFC21_090126 [Triticum aestivum]|uniref:DUF4283 domain-containing protein n=2 Tax=Triticum aestivum TaxID=4565 RepID=A0A9R1LDK0_WHEAT|nr:hypothetical protein CFC21_090126 [Triticum aestivum]
MPSPKRHVALHGVPILMRRWTSLSFASSHVNRYSVRLFLEDLPSHAWSINRVQRMLPECLIYRITTETLDKEDLSYFVATAWVEDLEEVPTVATLTVHGEPRPCSNPLAHSSMPVGFSEEGGMDDTCACTDHIPRLLHHKVLVHLDSVAYYPTRPAGAVRRTGPRGDHDKRDDTGDGPPPEEHPMPWARGFAANDYTHYQQMQPRPVCERRQASGRGGGDGDRYRACDAAGDAPITVSIQAPNPNIVSAVAVKTAHAQLLVSAHVDIVSSAGDDAAAPRGHVMELPQPEPTQEHEQHAHVAASVTKQRGRADRQLALPMISSLREAPSSLDSELRPATTAPALSAAGSWVPYQQPWCCGLLHVLPRISRLPWSTVAPRSALEYP